MENGISTQRLLELVLKPIVRFLVRRGVMFQEFDSAARRFFVDAATAELGKTTQKINVSRLSVATGLQRSEVQKYMGQSPIEPTRSLSLATRVLGQWEQDSRFVTKDGSPRTLRHDSERSEFADLCASVSTAINAGTLLFELQRTGRAILTPRGVKMLSAESSASSAFADFEKVHEMLGQDIELLLSAVDQNAYRRNPVPNMHSRTEYDNIYVGKIEHIRAWLMDEGKLFHKKLREYLSRFDQDVTPTRGNAQRAGARVVVTSASLTSFPIEMDVQGKI